MPIYEENSAMPMCPRNCLAWHLRMEHGKGRMTCPKTCAIFIRDQRLFGEGE